MQMTNEDILKEFKEAKNKHEQVKILADLNLCTVDQIVGILKAQGVDGRQLPHKKAPKPTEPRTGTPAAKQTNHNKTKVLDFILDTGMSYCLGSAVVYISHTGETDNAKRVKDLQNAIDYIKREIDHLKATHTCSWEAEA